MRNAGSLVELPQIVGSELAERSRTLQRLILAGTGVLFVALLASISLDPSTLWVHFPYAGMLVEHLIALAIHRRGHLRTAVAVHAALYSGVVIATMWMYGGVRAPAGFVLPPIVLLVGLTWNGRAALVTAGAVSAAMLALVILEEQGVIRGTLAPAPPLLLWIVASSALVITGVILHVALSIIHRSRAEIVAKEHARHALEESLTQSRRLEAVGRLAAGVAHDFNNVLTVIFANAGQLSQQQDPEIRAAATSTLDAAERASNLTRQLLAYGRRQVLEPKIVDIHRFLRDSEKLLGRFLADDVRLVLDLDAEPAFVRVDRTQLEQVVLNLIVNARDAMPHGGTVTLRTRRGADGVHIQVTDTGVGMSPEVQARIFEPFFSTKQRGQGTGLGLATVHAVVEQSGGRVEVESTPGRGACFTVVLPAERTPGPIVLPPALPRTVVRASVLVVDDDPYVREAVAGILNAAGHEVRTAADESSAMNALGSSGFAPDLLLIDVVMPEVTGPELAARLRERLPELRVLFMSGYADDRLSVQGVLADGVHLISKPFDAPAILERVGAVLAGDAPGAIIAPQRRY